MEFLVSEIFNHLLSSAPLDLSNKLQGGRRIIDLESTDAKWVDLFVQYFIHQASNHDYSNSRKQMDSNASERFSSQEKESKNAHGALPHSDSDDLLFFVRATRSAEFAISKEPIVFVKRRVGRSLPALDDLIAWKETFLLNLIVQLPFQMSVSICEKNNDESPNISPHSSPQFPTPSVAANSSKRLRGSASSLVPLKSTHRPVYASPHRTRMDKKSEFVELSFPTIYFCINDFEDESLESLVLLPNQHLCVELSALIHPAFSAESNTASISSDSCPIVASLDSTSLPSLLSKMDVTGSPSSNAPKIPSLNSNNSKTKVVFFQGLWLR